MGSLRNEEESDSALHKKQWDDIFFSMEYHLYWKLKNSRFEFFEDEKYGIFEPKSLWKYDIYWLLKSSCFDLFGNGKCGLFLSQEGDGTMIFTDYGKVLVLNVSVVGNTVFFSQGVDRKMIFTG